MVFGIGSTLGPESDSVSAFAIEVASDAELIRFVENLKKQIRIFRLENEVLEASIMRLQPSLMTGVYSAFEYAKKLSQSTLTLEGSSRSRFTLTEYGQSSLNFKSTSRMSYRKLEPSLKASSVKISRSIISRSIIGSAGPKINVEERQELVHVLMENQRNDLKKFKSGATKQNAYLEAQLEEIALRTIDLDKWTLDFEKEVVIEGVEMMTKRIAAETWIRFMTEQGKKVDRQVDKLRLRTSTANTQHRKLREDIKRKKDLVSRLMAVDFQIKTIEITETLRAMEKKNHDLIELKAFTGDTHLNLTMHKYDLMNTTEYLKKIENLKHLRKIQTVKLDAERASLEEQVKSLEQNLNGIQKQRRTYFVPDVLEYVRVKLEISELNNSIKRLETSLSIKQCAVRSFKRRSMNLSKILISKKKLESRGESTNDEFVCEAPLRVIEFHSPKGTCSPCGLMPRN